MKSKTKFQNIHSIIKNSKTSNQMWKVGSFGGRHIHMVFYIYDAIEINK